MDIAPWVRLKYSILNHLQKSGLAVTPKRIMTFINNTRQFNKNIYITGINGSTTTIRTYVTAMRRLAVNTPEFRVDSFRNPLIALRDQIPLFFWDSFSILFYCIHCCCFIVYTYTHLIAPTTLTAFVRCRAPVR